MNMRPEPTRTVHYNAPECALQCIAMHWQCIAMHEKFVMAARQCIKMQSNAPSVSMQSNAPMHNGSQCITMHAMHGRPAVCNALKCTAMHPLLQCRAMHQCTTEFNVSQCMVGRLYVMHSNAKQCIMSLNAPQCTAIVLVHCGARVHSPNAL